MANLSVNINKLALIRNSRGKNNPDLEWWGEKILQWGSHGLTVHPRPDGRHIRNADVPKLEHLIQRWNQAARHPAELNIEGYPSQDYIQLVKETRPHQCTLVPDPPAALTSNAGWDFVKNDDFLKGVCAQLKDLGCRVSLFLDPATISDAQLEALERIDCDRIELYTEAFADAYGTPDFQPVLETYVTAALKAGELGLELNAGHDLNLQNLGALIDAIPEIREVSIGHALTCEALLDGFEKTITHYLRILKDHGAHD